MLNCTKAGVTMLLSLVHIEGRRPDGWCHKIHHENKKGINAKQFPEFLNFSYFLDYQFN
jgi:hypothetical protein